MRLITTLFLGSVLSLLSACNDSHAESTSSTNTNIKSTSTETILNNYKTEKVAPHTYVIHGPLEMPTKANKGFMNNPGFIIIEKSVVVVDPGSSVQVGRELVSRIKAMTKNPITHVFNSHVHGDHWLGNQAIKEAFPAASFYAHPMMIKSAKAGEADHWVNLMDKLTEGLTKGTTAVIPTQALTDKQTIIVDNIHFIAHLSKIAHSETDAMIEVVEDKLLFTGDNITSQRLPRMTDGSFAGNIAAANTGLALDITTVVPGHGLTGDKTVLEDYRDYLDGIIKNVTTLAEEDDLEAFEMKPIIMEKLAKYKDWSGFEEQVGKHISLAIAEIEESGF